jgi:hypothetical protein
MLPPAIKNHQQQVHACGTWIPKLMPYNVNSARNACTHMKSCARAAGYMTVKQYTHHAQVTTRAPSSVRHKMAARTCKHTNNPRKQVVQRWNHTQIKEWQPSSAAWI